MEETWKKNESLDFFQTWEVSEKERPEFIPVYVVEGFLDAGKTSLLNMLMYRRLFRGDNLLLIQFERGEEEPISAPKKGGSLDVLRFSIKEIQRDIEEVAEQIYSYLIHHDPDQIWVEWNGVLSFSLLQALFPPVSNEITGTPGDFGQIKKVLHLADAGKLEGLITQTDGVLLEQISSSDVVVLRNVDSTAHLRQWKRLIQGWNPGGKVLPLKPLQDVERELGRAKRNPDLTLWMGVICFTAAYFLLRFALGRWGSSPAMLDTLVNVFLGILLQAVPFLLVGVLLSSAIQILVSRQFIERWFPKRLVGGMLFAILAGFCLPVCDCASIPVFRSLVRKGVPLAAAVTFMAATPIINPVAILSTWYAFNGKISFVLCRIGLGILCAVLIGITFTGRNLGREDVESGFSGILCTCSCCNGTASDGRRGKLLLCMEYAKSEFFDVGKYLILGAFVSALIQTLGGDMSWDGGGNGLLLPLVLMMGMAFFLSLCSSSDAVVARSFAGQFPTGALMAFLVFGPMMDIKNLILLSGSFSTRFMIRLTLTMFLICGTVVYLAFCFGLERVLV